MPAAHSSSLVRLLAGSIRPAAGSAVYVAIAFAGAGRLDWTRGWIYAAVFVAVSIVGSLIVRAANPGLLEARAKGLRTDTKPFDRAFYLAFIPLTLVYPLLAGMDAARFSWQPLPWWTVWPGALLFVSGSLLGTWTMVVNPHAESTVRIQHERDHAVVTRGPYRVVRHPMYAGMIVGLPGTALMLGSAWAALPMLLVVVLLVWRTAREDRTLRQELPGYEDYASITRCRLVPGLW
jgi:protein-S-isoprenylcysteine O-methyltransferase Ste14